ncbi:hypothetical protein Microterr_29970 [Microbacterium terricola]|uniref:Uncharacterized protein n=1 Tax=Microbacterium terricola TaxID=344163 RepID=A0ABM8E2Y7_9MICO|nr:hypothetical protein Microterr_29970 [Microbacterium terricola]
MLHERGGAVELAVHGDRTGAEGAEEQDTGEGDEDEISRQMPVSAGFRLLRILSHGTSLGTAGWDDTGRRRRARARPRLP